MTLDESIDSLSMLNSSEIDFYVDPSLVEFLTDRGTINIDFVTHEGRSGFTVTVGGGCAESGCEGCSPAG
jgi:Fe-S cluster assembly iron-binding protein IscA